MQLVVISVGKRGPAWLRDAVSDYVRRFPREAALRPVDITPVRRSRDEPAGKVLKAEALKIRAAIPERHRLIALAERGSPINTRGLAGRMRGWMDAGENIAFVIGGPDGLDPGLIDAADESWSLSALTLQHGLARLVLIEQLYRAWTILSNHPYHRE